MARTLRAAAHGWPRHRRLEFQSLLDACEGAARAAKLHRGRLLAHSHLAKDARRKHGAACGAVTLGDTPHRRRRIDVAPCVWRTEAQGRRVARGVRGLA
eukprot:1392996-Prymnesium_polylepis.1